MTEQQLRIAEMTNYNDIDKNKSQIECIEDRGRALYLHNAVAFYRPL